MRSLFAVCLGLSFAGCATTGSSGSQGGALKNKSNTPTLSSNAGGPNAKGKYVCEYEEDTGTHLRNKVCRYVDSDDDTRGQTQDAIREWQRSMMNVKRQGNNTDSGG